MTTRCPRLAIRLKPLYITAHMTCESDFFELSTLNRTVGTILTYECQTGCRSIHSTKQLQCATDGTWRPSIPFCTEESSVKTGSNTIEGLSPNDVRIIGAVGGVLGGLLFTFILVMLFCMWHRKRKARLEQKKIYLATHNSTLSRSPASGVMIIPHNSHTKYNSYPSKMARHKDAYVFKEFQLHKPSRSYDRDRMTLGDRNLHVDETQHASSRGHSRHVYESEDAVVGHQTRSDGDGRENAGFRSYEINDGDTSFDRLERKVGRDGAIYTIVGNRPRDLWHEDLKFLSGSRYSLPRPEMGDKFEPLWGDTPQL